MLWKCLTIEASVFMNIEQCSLLWQLFIVVRCPVLLCKAFFRCWYVLITVEGDIGFNVKNHFLNVVWTKFSSRVRGWKWLVQTVCRKYVLKDMKILSWAFRGNTLTLLWRLRRRVGSWSFDLIRINVVQLLMTTWQRSDCLGFSVPYVRQEVFWQL